MADEKPTGVYLRMKDGQGALLTNEKIPGKLMGEVLGCKIVAVEDLSHIEDPDDLPDPFESPAIECVDESVPAPASLYDIRNLMLVDRIALLEKELPYLREKCALLEGIIVCEEHFW